MKEIVLTRGMVALVDDGDYEWLNQWKWCVDVNKTRKVRYAKRRRRGSKPDWIRMHREVLGLTNGDGKIVDHKNRNGLDNRRENLHLVSKTENCHNRGVCKANTSGHNGVSWYKPYRKWHAYIKVDCKRIHLGYHSNIEDAVKARAQGEEVYW